MSDLVGKHIESLKPYVPGKPVEELERELGITNSLKLASNENPLGPSPAAVEAVRKLSSDLHIYPDGAGYKLREALANRFDVPMDEVVLGNGSNELLTLIVRAFCQPGDTGIVSDYSFIAYRIVMQAAGVEFVSTPMKDGFVHDLDAMAAAVTDSTKVIFVANPNNPTGSYVGRRELEKFLREVPEQVIVVLDEAYVEYALADDYTSALEMRDLRERLIITRTFSKCYGLAGLRVGFGIGPAPMLDYINRIREPFNCNLLAQHGALAALGDEAFVTRSVESNEAGREVLETGLAALADQGVTWTPSQTNFLLIETPHNGGEVYDAMLRRGVIVRPMAGYGLANHLRITIGTEAEVERCLDALRGALEEVGGSL